MKADVTMHEVWLTCSGGPFGTLTVKATCEGVSSIHWEDQSSDASPVEPPGEWVGDSIENAAARRMAEMAAQQLQEYFAGVRRTFDVPLVLRGTPFQRAVWEVLVRIPFGETRTYGDVARAIGNEKAVRAVGQANRANPIPIIVPCHRVMGTNGTLTGYAGSQVHLKQALLSLELSYPLQST